ncbi:MAG: hypothetical protein KJZ77_16755 [Anaerolineales bacterium]|nr:hypothetical protein [Anaerolineales bacterium]
MSAKSKLLLFLMLILLVQACTLPDTSEPMATPIRPIQAPTLAPVVELPATSVPVSPIQHQVFPASAPNSSLSYDVESVITAPEQRAPFGDSYDINRLERPFLQDMTYIPDLDIRTFGLGRDADWIYVSIGLIGEDPNNSIGIDYGVEFDINNDGYGDFVMVASPPYTDEWTAANVRVYADKNRNTSGLSAVRSDAPFSSDGYETLLFDGSLTTNEDTDMVWVRMNAGPNATVQFAIKQAVIGNVFMYGVFADADLKDISQLDYVDRFTEEDAGSPIKDKRDYPLKALHSFDNTCREAHGFTPTGYEPMLCPKDSPTPQPKEVAGCTNPELYSDQSSCEAAGCAWRINPGVFIAVVYYCTFP